MKLKASFLFVVGLAAVTAQEEQPEKCTAGVNTQACTLPDGTEGKFVCHQCGDGGKGGRHGGPHHAGGRHGRGHHHHHPHGGHRRGLGASLHDMMDKLMMPHSSSSSSSSSSDSWDGPPQHPWGGDHGGPGGDRHHPPRHYGLSRTHCVPKVRPADRPFHHHPPPLKCGCCNETCPKQLDCGCKCDLTDPEGNLMEDGLGAGVWVTMTRFHDDPTTSLKEQKCVPAKGYADADRVQCVETCTTVVADDETVAINVARKEEEKELDEEDQN